MSKLRTRVRYSLQRDVIGFYGAIEAVAQSQLDCTQMKTMMMRKMMKRTMIGLWSGVDLQCHSEHKYTNLTFPQKPMELNE